MARITVEDCLDKIPNRFELVMVASKRARLLMQSAVDPKVPWENDKATVVALREIAKGLVTQHTLIEVDDPEDAFYDVVLPVAAVSAPIVAMDEDEDSDEDLALDAESEPAAGTEEGDENV